MAVTVQTEIQALREAASAAEAWEPDKDGDCASNWFRRSIKFVPLEPELRTMYNQYDGEDMNDIELPSELLEFG